MWTDEARQASADARKAGAAGEKAKDAKVVQNIRNWLGIVPGGPKGGPGTQAMRDAAAAATLAQGHPKSSVPSNAYAIQARGATILGQPQGPRPWRTEKVVGASKSVTNPAAKAERIAMRMASDSRTRSAPSKRQAFRVK